MKPEIWGRCMWESMHYIAAAYPQKPSLSDKRRYCQYFKALANVMPCKSCGISFRKYIKEIDITKYLQNRRRLLYWTYLIHNKVNRKLKKSIHIPWANVEKKYLKGAFK